MALYFTFRFAEDSVAASAPPAWCIDVRTDIAYPEGGPAEGWPEAEIDAIQFEGSFRGITIWPAFWQPTNAVIRSTASFTIRLPLTREQIETIERLRAGSAPLQFKTKINLRARAILSTGNPGQTVYLAQRTNIVNSQEMILTVDRDKWAGILKTIGWAEIEIFEVEPGALGDDPAIQDAIGRLRQAEHAFRTRSGPDEVLVHCFKALEGIAKAKGAGDLVAGFKVLMEETFPKDEGKRTLVNEVIRKVKDFAHFGRHEEIPPVTVSFDEARFILTTTMGLMQLMTANNRSRRH